MPGRGLGQRRGLVNAEVVKLEHGEITVAVQAPRTAVYDPPRHQAVAGALEREGPAVDRVVALPPGRIKRAGGAGLERHVAQQLYKGLCGNLVAAAVQHHVITSTAVLQDCVFAPCHR